MFDLSQAKKSCVSAANCTRPYALGNLVNMLKDYTITNGIAASEIDIKVVVHSEGGFLLLKDEGYDGNGNPVTGRNKFQTNVEALMDDGVKFYFCQNTTRGFIKKGILLGCRNTVILATFHSPGFWIQNNLKNTLEPIENKI